MSSVDDRIVSMQFDNKAFERNIKQTMESLEDMNKTLEKANKNNGLKDLAGSLKDFDGLSKIGDALDNISSKFSAFGAIGFSVIQNLTNAAIDFGKNMFDATIGQILQGGKQRALNMEQARFMFQGLGMDIDASMASALEAVQGTAYGLDAAARVAAQFGAAGLEAGEEMTKALRGISGAAAMTGSSYEDIGGIMTSVAGQGRVTGQHLMQFATRGLNVAAAMAEQWGMTEAEVRKMASSGQISFQEFANAMDDAFGEHATRANETYTGSLSNMRAALSRIGANIQTPRLEATRKILNAFTPVIDKVNKAMKPLVDLWTEFQEIRAERTVAFLEGLDFRGTLVATNRLTNGIRNIGNLVYVLANSLHTAFRNIFPKQELSIFERLTKVFETFTGYFTIGSKGARALTNLLTNFFAVVKAGINVILDILRPLRDAFRQIFPGPEANSAIDTMKRISDAMGRLADRLTISSETADKLRRIFAGLFAAFDIGWQVIKWGAQEIWKALKPIFSGLSDGAPGALDWLAGIADKIVGFRTSLEDGGIPELLDHMRTAIKRFFEELTWEKVLNGIKDAFTAVGKAIKDFFSGLDISAPEGVSNTFGRLGDRMESLKPIFEGIGNALQWLWDILKKIGGGIKDFLGEHFSGIGDSIAATMESGDFRKVLDILNVGLLGAIAVMFRKFLRGGLSLDFSSFTEGINSSFEALTGSLQAMQTQIKANALFKIAAAIALLTASVLVMSMIDSDALTKALMAITIAFTQLVGAMALLAKITSVSGAGSLVVTAVGLGLVAGALLLLSFAVKNMAGLSWEELATGLSGVTALLAVLSISVKSLSANSGGMIRVGVGLIGVAIALNLLALAVKQFAGLSWEELGKGLAGVAGGMLTLALGMQLMPTGLNVKAAGMIGLAIALNILALAVKQFASLSWEEMAKGLVAVTGSLVGIGLAMKLMPKSLVATGPALIAVGIALNLIAKAVSSFAGLSWEELARGLSGLAGSLLILGVAAYAMTGSLAGAIAIGIMAVSLIAMAKAIKMFGSLSVSKLAKGLGFMALSLLAFGGVAAILSPVVVAMMGLGVAMLLVGGGFLAFGLGAAMVAKAIEILGKAGDQGLKMFLRLLDGIIDRIPTFITAISEGILAAAQIILDAAPDLVKSLGVVLGALIDEVINLVPQLAEAIKTLIDALLDIIQEKSPDIIAAGMKLLLDLLKGIRDNIGEVTTTVIEIILEFIGAITNKLGDIVEAGVNLLKEFLKGVAKNISTVLDAAGDIISEFIKGIGRQANKILDAGVAVLEQLIRGFGRRVDNITKAAGDVIVIFIRGLGREVKKIVDAGAAFIVSFIQGFGKRVNDIMKAGTAVIIAFIQGLASNALTIANAAAATLVSFINGLAAAIERYSPQLRAAGQRLAFAIADGMSFGLASKARGLINQAAGIGGGILGKVGGILGIRSPSREMMKIGRYIIDGLSIGIDKETSVLEKSLEKVVDTIFGIDNVDPTITPVLDLSQIEKDAKELGNIMGSRSISAELSSSQARSILSSMNRSQETPQETPQREIVPVEMKFEQNNYSPEMLSVDDIYRQTKGQIAMAKRELELV